MQTENIPEPGNGVKPRRKLFKRIVIYSAFVFVSLFVLPIVALQFSFVQTWAVNKISGMISKKLKTEVRVGQVNIGFFNRLLVKEIYVAGLDNDTLIHVGELSARIKKIPLFGNPLVIGEIELKDGQFNLKSDSIGANVGRIFGNLKDTTVLKDTTSNNFVLETHSLKISNFKYSMQLYGAETVEEKPYGIIYKNMYLDSVYMDADEIYLREDTVFFAINSLCFKERSGFNLLQFSSDSSYFAFGKDVHFKNLKLRDTYSEVNIHDFRMLYDNGDDFRDFVNKVYLRADVVNSKISFSTIGYFAPTLKNIPVTVEASGLISGPISNLRSNKIDINAMKGTTLSGSFSITGLPNMESTVIFADLKQLSTTKEDVFHVLKGLTNTDLSGIANTFSVVDYLNFSGTYTGLINDFVANGKLSTNVGTLNMDMLLKATSDVSTYFRGKLIAKNLKIGKLINSNFIGTSNFDLMVDGNMSQNKYNFHSKGNIASLELNDYLYENIQIEGQLNNREFNGAVNINDENIDLDFLGKVDLNTKTPPVFDFKADVRQLNLNRLNFFKRDSISLFKGQINANFTGKTILEYSGELYIKDASYTDPIGKIDLGTISLSSHILSDKNILSFNSDFLDVKYSGSYELKVLIENIQKVVFLYFPSLNSNASNKHNTHLSDSYKLEIKTKKSGDVARVLLPGLFISDNSTIDVSLDNSNRIHFDVACDKLALNQNEIHNLHLKSSNESDSITVALNTDILIIGGIKLKNFSTKHTARNSIISSEIFFKDEDPKMPSNAKIYFDTKLEEDVVRKYQKIEFQFFTSEFTTFGKHWDLHPSQINIDTSRIDIKNFSITNNKQELNIDGIISKSESELIKVELSNFNISSLNYFSQKMGYNIEGNTSGYVELKNLYIDPEYNSEFNLDNVVINQDTLGSIFIGSEWEAEKKRLNIVSRIYDHVGVSAGISGYFIPSTKKINLDAQITRLKLSYLNPILTGILSDIKGETSGLLKVRGVLDSPELSGNLLLNQIGLTVDYLKTRYKVNADIKIDKSLFSIQKGMIFDLNGQPGELTVEVKHDNFKNFTFDAFAKVHNLLSLDTKEYDNPLFYGTAYATGGIRLSGNPKMFKFDIVAEADKNSILYIPLNSSNEAKESMFLSFTEKKDKDKDKIRTIPIVEKAQKSAIELDMDLSVTSASEIQILIDPKVGDILRAKGQGNLKIEVNPSINLFSIVGDYRIEKGDYNFTVPNFSIISKKFTIDEGSQIKFMGDVSTAQLDVHASIKDRVAISALIPEDSSSYRRYNVISRIHISGLMTSPTLKFDLEFPDLEPEKKARIQTALNTEEKLTKQFLALLVARTFIPEQDSPQNDIGSTALVGNAAELLSGQIGSLISMFNLPIPLDVNVDYSMDPNRTGRNNYDIDFSTQIFDRVLISGTAGTSTQANRNFVGDFEMEYMVGRGNLRFKAFTKSHDYFAGDMETNRQGVGVSYQGVFEKIKDLITGKARKERKLQEKLLKEKEQQEKKRKEEKNSPLIPSATRVEKEEDYLLPENEK